MALQSMTGFARYASRHLDTNIVWEIKSVNGKSLDIRFRIPPGFEGVELPVRKLLSERFRRGNFQASLSIDQASRQMRPVINEQLLGEIADVAAGLREKYDLAPSTAEGLLSVRGVLEMPQETQDETDTAALEAAAIACFGNLLEAIEKHRQTEGSSLGQILNAHVDTIELLVEQARRDPARSLEEIRKRLASQVSLLMETGANLDEDRLHMEAAFLATKADIQEELERLEFHVSSARSLLTEGGAIGRKLDFLSQEFNREANTLCSKSNAPSITTIGLELKAVVDQFREQVQNLE